MINVGITLPNYRGMATPASILETAERAERVGLHSVWVADHVAIPTAGVPNMGSVLYETQTTLSVIAGRTRSVKLGFTVMPTPYRHPLLQARMLATLDQLSGGRVIYGGATGYLEQEFRALGLPFERRAAITDEYLQVLKMAWTQDIIEFHGEFVDCSDITCDPKPLQKPHPPIWLGGDSDGAFRRIVRFADGWHGLLGGSPGARREPPTLDNFRKRVAHLREIAEAVEPRSGDHHLICQGKLLDRTGRSRRPSIAWLRQQDRRRSQATGGPRTRVGRTHDQSVTRADELDVIDQIGEEIRPQFAA